jgi:hypothetical protein
MPSTNLCRNKKWLPFHNHLFPMHALAALVSFIAVTGAAAPLTANSGSTNSDTAVATGLNPNPTNGLGSWIWAPQVSDHQTVFLWKSFKIPDSAHVLRAQLSMTTDDKFTVFLDGRELGHGAEWRELFVFGVTPLLSSGRHVLAVRAFNSHSGAGMILGLQVDLEDGTHIAIKSDKSWKVVPSGIKNWEKVMQPALDWQPAVVEAPLGGFPWWDRPLHVNVMPTLTP